MRGLIAAAVVVTTGVLFVSIRDARWTRETASMEADLAGVPPPAPSIGFEGVDRLPPPVQRYLRSALRQGGPSIRAVRLEQSGRLRTGVESDAWLAFYARETIAPVAKAFVWDAHVSVAPLVHVRVRDSYAGGVAQGEVAFQSAIPVSHDRGGHDLNAGELFRLLAEAPWAPTLLLPGTDVSWSAKDDRSAVATLAQGGERVAVEFRFDGAGDVATVYAADRPRAYSTTFVPTPWEGHFSRYEVVDGVRVPRAGAVGWWIDGRWIPVWEGRIDAITIDRVR